MATQRDEWHSTEIHRMEHGQQNQRDFDYITNCHDRAMAGHGSLIPQSQANAEGLPWIQQSRLHRIPNQGEKIFRCNGLGTSTLLDNGAMKLAKPGPYLRNARVHRH